MIDSFFFDLSVTSVMAGYSGTPLLKKLGIKPGSRIYISEPPAQYFDWISPMPDAVKVSDKLTDVFDFIHVFVRDQKTFQVLLSKSKKHLQVNGMIWVSWPKKSSGIGSDLDENKIRDYGLKIGLVDIKVCAVDETWSGLKFVIPVKDR
jgi:hypothetical protein